MRLITRDDDHDLYCTECGSDQERVIEPEQDVLQFVVRLCSECLRAAQERLENTWPEAYPRADLCKNVSPRDWTALYQQQPEKEHVALQQRKLSPGIV